MRAEFLIAALPLAAALPAGLEDIIFRRGSVRRSYQMNQVPAQDLGGGQAIGSDGQAISGGQAAGSKQGAGESTQTTSGSANQAPTEEYKAAAVDLHNKARASYNGAPALSWSDTLAEDAVAWSVTLCSDPSGDLRHGHSTAAGKAGVWGQNLASVASMNSTVNAELERAFKSWDDEKKDYVAGSDFSMATGHFTQIVWKKTTQVGCATVQCPGGNNQLTTMYTTCNYYPAGNVQGKFGPMVDQIEESGSTGATGTTTLEPSQQDSAAATPVSSDVPTRTGKANISSGHSDSPADGSEPTAGTGQADVVDQVAGNQLVPATSTATTPTATPPATPPATQTATPTRGSCRRPGPGKTPTKAHMDGHMERPPTEPAPMENQIA
ncbi:CAP domain-containing protein [Purpureocillium lavendulum]|uniref:CAP domain-containing protein n=1 Tax=Purpureocillium lavendulum TaxID=1247861 RepID=A0AB34FGA6_9HYPO|nr:CAP domain-containing protein [Purpureocillium lavendulum]